LSICIAHRRKHASNALFVTDQSRQPHSHRVQPANTGWRNGPAKQPQSAVLRSPLSVTRIMGYYSFNWPRRDGRLSWPCWSNSHPSV